ncbi:MMPL family transporter [Oceanobacillus massiliensis]|uniref:MMPL family transporter n=1 Tax=Oceanobacillus massiliensis TaxID=1465765 RepID=UPI000288B6BD|nr:MMPL family transporter [Oceanobacillus massiliensis]
MNKLLNNLGRVVAGSKSRWITLLVWVISIILLSAIWPAVNEEESNMNNLLPEDAMSLQAANIISEEFPTDGGIPLLLAWYRDGGLNEDDVNAIQSLYKTLQEEPLYQQTMVPPLGNLPGEALLNSASEDGEALTTPIFFDENASADELKIALDSLKEIITTVTQEQPLSKALTDEGLHVRFTGAVGIQTDATELFSQADFTLLIATVLLVLILLIILYRSPILAIIPLIGVGFAYGLISPLLGMMAREGWIVVDSQAISIMTVLLFGAGTDYCLFLVSRYRDELQLEPNKYKALQFALANSGGAILMSGLTTVLGLLALSLANYASYDRFAVPFSLSILVMAIAVITLLPALLSIFGRIAFYPFIPRTEEMTDRLEKKKGKPVRHQKTRSRFSKATGRLVTEKPWRIIIITLIFLCGFALIVPKIEYTYGMLESFPEDMPSREGFSIISDHYPKGEIAPIEVIMDTKGQDIHLKENLESLEVVNKVEEPTSGKNNPDIQKYQVILAIDPYSPEATEQIPVINQTAVEILEKTGIDEAEKLVWISGETAELYDTYKITKADQNRIIPVVLIIIALLLLVYLRSIIAMAYLLITVVLSFMTALGLGWILIHYGMETSAMQGLIPLYAFVFLVALGGDYNIFMISSIWKKSKIMPIKDAIASGVEETSSVITSAGLILAGTFSALAVMPLEVLVQFGAVTAIGVLLDTFVVRPLLVPALTTVLGRFAFWPGHLWKKEKREKAKR